ncbi:MAG: hypothetical protein M1549_02995 [Candidatus Dependentiae bacterium]|nr:hypothetical protein [Candidatus Dependentiae bacterium]
MNSSNFSEVIESSLSGWTAQCWDPAQSAAVGTLVVVSVAIASVASERLFGIVHEIVRDSSDPTRMPYAYQKTEEELQRDQPQIFSFLRTTCRCIGTGFSTADGTISYNRAAQPPKIHAFVRVADAVEADAFFARADYLDLLAGALPQPTLDELLLAILREQREQFLPQNPALLTFLAHYAQLINHDYARLRRFTRRVEMVMK